MSIKYHTDENQMIVFYFAEQNMEIIICDLWIQVL